MREFASRATRLLALALRLARLGPDVPGKGKIIGATLLMPLKRRLPWSRGKWLRLRLRVFGSTVSLVTSDLSDLRVIDDVFLREDYALQGLQQPSVILDLGSNSGVSVLYFRLRYPHARIVGVEPDPIAFAKLTENTRGIDQVELVNAAVTAADGEALLFRSDESWGSSLIPNTGSEQPIVVKGRSLDSLIEDRGLERIDLLKLDIEGSEFEVLRAFTRVDRVGALTGELHFDLADGSMSEVRSVLQGFDVSLTGDPAGRVIFSAVRQNGRATADSGGDAAPHGG